jgi:excisionase family DNA binding protein
MAKRAKWKCRNPTNFLTFLRRFPMLPQHPLSVSFKEAAEITSVSRSTLRRHAKSGHLRTVRLGRRRVIPFDALQDLIREGSWKVLVQDKR